MDLGNQNPKNEPYNKNIIINNLTENRNSAQTIKECCYHLLVGNV